MNTPNNSILIDNRSRYTLDPGIFSDIWDILTVHESLDPGNYVNLLLTDDDTIAKLNKKFLGREGYTDVISFPSDNKDIPLLGDIIIDVRIAEEQKGTGDLEFEVQILFLHGMLHLLGYDHLSKTDKKSCMKKRNFTSTS